MTVSTNQTRRYLKLTRRVTTCYMWSLSGTSYQGNNGGLWWGSNSRLTGIHRSWIGALPTAPRRIGAQIVFSVSHMQFRMSVCLAVACTHPYFGRVFEKSAIVFQIKLSRAFLTNLQCFFALIHSIFPTLLCLYIDMWTYRCNTVSSFPFFDVDSCICMSLCQFQPSKLKLYTHTV